MTKEEITKAYENRWRIKSEHIEEKLEQMLIQYRVEYVKELCRDFFEAGLLLAKRDTVSVSQLNAVKSEMPITDEEALYLPRPSINENVKLKNNIFNKISFDVWWDMYDLKCGKEKCQKKWEKLSPKEQAECLEATPAYVASTPDKQFRKRPLTYLNGKCWNDEIIMRDNGKSTSPDAAERLTDILIG